MSDKPEQAEIARSAQELLRAHDILAFFLSEEKLQKRLLREKDRQGATSVMSAALDVLCWALGHDDHNERFGFNMQTLETAFNQAGYMMHEDGSIWGPPEEGDGPLPS